MTAPRLSRKLRVAILRKDLDVTGRRMSSSLFSISVPRRSSVRPGDPPLPALQRQIDRTALRKALSAHSHDLRACDPATGLLHIPATKATHRHARAAQGHGAQSRPVGQRHCSPAPFTRRRSTISRAGRAVPVINALSDQFHPCQCAGRYAGHSRTLSALPAWPEDSRSSGMATTWRIP